MAAAVRDRSQTAFGEHTLQVSSFVQNANDLYTVCPGPREDDVRRYADAPQIFSQVGAGAAVERMGRDPGNRHEDLSQQPVGRLRRCGLRVVVPYLVRHGALWRAG